MAIERKLKCGTYVVPSVCVLLLCLHPVSAIGNVTAISKPLRVLAVLEPPFMMKDHKTGKMSGFMLDILELIGVPVASVETIDDTTYGMEENPQILEDVAGNLAEENSDIAVTSFGIRSRHSAVVAFSQPVLKGGYMVLYRLPDTWNTNKLTIETMLQPFSPGLWCLIIIMSLVVTAALYVIRRFSPLENSNSLRRDDSTSSNSVTGAFVYLFSSLVGQSHQVTPKSASGRFLVGTWWLFTAMTVAAYVASLVVILFREDPNVRTLPFTGVDEMLKQSDVSILVVEDSDTYNYMSQHSGYWERKVYNMWKENPKKLMVDSMETALELMDKGNGKYAVFMEETAADYLANQEPCNRMVISEPIGDKAFGFACKKGTTYCDDISAGVMHLRESGQMRKLREKWFWSGCRRNMGEIIKGDQFVDTFGGHTNVLTPLTITITRFSAAFIVLAVGITLALLAMLAELIYSRQRGFPLRSSLIGSSDDTQRINEH